MDGSTAGGCTDPWRLGPSDRDQPAGRVLPLVLGTYLEDFREAEPAVRSDGDPEDLHRFRVSLRRARSLMAVGSDVLPSEELVLLQALASWFANVTSPVRDLDVLLVDLDDLGRSVVPELHDALDELRVAVAAQRADAFDALVAELDGDRYPVLLRRWQAMTAVVRVGGSDPGPDARRPMGEVSDQLIWSSYRRLRRRGRRAMSTDDLDAWHDLRKAIKRFRYLVAAFAPMYPDSAFEQVPRRLADLQDTLGRLQDHHVQAAWIETIGVSAGGRAALAAGVVANTLHERSDRAHDHCREAWSEFDRPKLRRRLRVLLTA